MRKGRCSGAVVLLTLAVPALELVIAAKPAVGVALTNCAALRLGDPLSGHFQALSELDEEIPGRLGQRGIGFAFPPPTIDAHRNPDA